MNRLADALTLLRRRGPSRFVEIQAELGSPNRATFSRWLRGNSGAVVSFGKKRTGIYVAARDALGRVVVGGRGERPARR